MPTRRVIAAMRARSRVLFGQACKLEVLVTIAEKDGDTFTLADLGATPETASRYHKVLQNLCRAELLDKLPRAGKTVPYRRLPSQLWVWVGEYTAGLPNQPPDL